MLLQILLDGSKSRGPEKFSLPTLQVRSAAVWDTCGKYDLEETAVRSEQYFGLVADENTTVEPSSEVCRLQALA